jgi:hypothetical protein
MHNRLKILYRRKIFTLDFTELVIYRGFDSYEYIGYTASKWQGDNARRTRNEVEGSGCGLFKHLWEDRRQT